MGTETLRDQISANVEALETTQEVTPATPAETPPAVEAVETPAGRTAGRQRDEQGRLLPGKAVKETSAAGQEKAPPAQTNTAQATQPAPAAETKPKYQRPSTWKKETWGVWDKLNKGEVLTPQEIHLMAEEAIRRDSDFSRGVSTYKQEWETAKPLIDAMAPFMPLLQQHKIEPSQWIGNLGRAHQTLALGSPEQKLAAFIRLAGEYRVPVEQMFARGQDGQWYFNQQTLQQAAQQQPQQQPQDVRQVVQETLAKERADQKVAEMSADTKTYPHFEEVRQTMAGLLQAGLSDGPEDAYKAALQHPKHFHLYEAQQQQQRETEQREKAEAARRATEAARRKAISPRSATPTSVATGAAGTKGLRSTLEEAFDSTVQGRV